VISAS